MPGPDEFEWIARLRPLARGSAAAMDLLDDAAVLPSRAGHDLVITKDAMVEGVHFLTGEARDIVARRLLRTNLSDLAAKGAEPFGYLLMTAWPTGHTVDEEAAFAAGLADDGDAFGLTLLGGDTVSTPGPLAVSATLLGWAPRGKAVRRNGAKPGDILMVTGAIGDGYLGLLAARGEIQDTAGRLAARYRLPEPRLGIAVALRRFARAAADVSDGLLADALHIADASACEAHVELEHVPASADGVAWLDSHGGDIASRLRLASGGDDYEIVCAVPPKNVAPFREACAQAGLPLTVVGRFVAGQGLKITYKGINCAASDLGWRHR
jgi:thiamine-monophosphate kinase